MVAVEFRLKLSSAYSIRVPYSYQCARTYPLPAPSTIKGLCANALWRVDGGNPVDIIKRIHDTSLGATSRSEYAIAVSPCTVRVIPMNALLRQFAFTPYIDCMIVLKNGAENLGKKIAEALKASPVYLGDSESLVSILPNSVEVIKNYEDFKEGDMITGNSVVKFDFIKEKSINEKGVVLYMQDNPCNIDAVLERYIAPLKQNGDSYEPLNSLSFIAAKKGLIVKGKSVHGIFSNEQQEPADVQKPKRSKKKKA